MPIVLTTIVSARRRRKLRLWGLLIMLLLAPMARAEENAAACLAQAEADPDQALARANIQLQRDPKDTAAMHCRALALFNGRDYLSSAMQFSHLARATTPEKSAAVFYDKAAWAYMRAHQNGAAAQELINAIERDPDKMLYRQDYAVALMNGERYWDAVKEFDHVVQRNPRAVAALALRADCWLRLGQGSRARHDAKRVLEIEPQHELAQAIIDKLRAQAEDAP